MKLNILGGATTKFGELWGLSPRDLARKAVGETLKESNINAGSIDALFVGNMLSGMLGHQEHLGPFFAEALGLPVPAFRIEGACASGGLAFHAAVNSILSGQYDTVLVLGIEKMTDFKPEEVASALMAAGSDEERVAGMTFPGLYAMLARAHMEKYGTKSKDLASVAVKNHFHASLNPDAQFHSLISVEQVLNSSCIADPLRLLDCSPISDGAASVILSSKEKFISKKNCVTVKASEVATDSLGLAGRDSLTQIKATRKASYNAFEKAGLETGDVDVAEVHDCFTIAEILAMEDIGFFAPAEAAGYISKGDTTLGKSKKLVVNTSGGLKGSGHPVGATGIKQIVEIYRQLAGKANDRQVEGAKVGLTHNVGGSGATAVVNIFTK